MTARLAKAAIVGLVFLGATAAFAVPGTAVVSWEDKK